MNENIREKPLLKERLSYLEKVSNGFKIKPYIVKDYNGKFELDKLREALGYKIGWTEIVWNKVRERNGRKV